MQETKFTYLWKLELLEWFIYEKCSICSIFHKRKIITMSMLKDKVGRWIKELLNDFLKIRIVIVR